MHIQHHGGCIMAEKMTLEVFFFFRAPPRPSQVAGIVSIVGELQSIFSQYSGIVRDMAELRCFISHAASRSSVQKKEQKEVGGVSAR